jgi:uncharacterized protein
MKKRRLVMVGILATLALGIGLASNAFWIEPRSLTVREMTIQTPQWRGPPLRIALLSDIHGDQFHMPVKRIRALSAAAAALQPDIVLLAGDYVGGHFGQSGLPGAKLANRTAQENAFEAEVVTALKSFHAPHGVFAVMGNHDCWWDCGEVRRLLKGDEVTLLENRAVQVKRDAGPFWVVGIEDGQTQAPDFILAKANIPDSADVLTVVHNPGLFRWPSNTASIQFSGHSHGGQVRFPIVGAPVRMSRFTEETVEKPLVKDSRVLVVTTGVGEVGLPVRFGVPPEIALITISNGAVVSVTAQKRRSIVGGG